MERGLWCTCSDVGQAARCSILFGPRSSLRGSAPVVRAAVGVGFAGGSVLICADAGRHLNSIYVSDQKANSGQPSFVGSLDGCLALPFLSLREAISSSSFPLLHCLPVLPRLFRLLTVSIF